MVALSCYIRAKNEERMIGKVVTSALAVAEEVIIIDSGSTDLTCALASAAGARIIHAPWLGWGKQKRLGEDACTNDWVLDLDADEIVSGDLAEEIKDLFSRGAPLFAIYEMPMATVPPVGRAWLTFNLVRRRKLYDRRVVRSPDHAIWDQFNVPQGVVIGKLRNALLHYSFVDLEQLSSKFNRHSSASSKSRLKPFWQVMMRLCFCGPYYFLNHFIRRGLWRAGAYGFAVSTIAAHGRWLKDAKMLERHYIRTLCGSDPNDPAPSKASTL